jgi:hypothetical protein
MIERPILFSGPMVRAILDGQKTQTRRVVKYIPDLGEPENWCCDNIDEEFFIRLAGNYRRYCPYGVPGDRLWVRETFYAWGKWEPYLDGKKDRWRFLYHTDVSHPVRYQATEGDRFYQGPANGGDDYHCRPSIFMPRWASRITLEVKGVRAERLQDITEADSQDEGVIPSIVAQKYRSGFQTLWDSINKKRGYGWDTNPWVWAVEFMMI